LTFLRHHICWASPIEDAYHLFLSFPIITTCWREGVSSISKLISQYDSSEYFVFATLWILIVLFCSNFLSPLKSIEMYTSNKAQFLQNITSFIFTVLYEFQWPTRKLIAKSYAKMSNEILRKDCLHQIYTRVKQPHNLETLYHFSLKFLLQSNTQE